MTWQQANYSKRNMNSMINSAKRQAMEMNQKSESKQESTAPLNEKIDDDFKKNENIDNEQSQHAFGGLNEILGILNGGMKFDEDTILIAGLLFILYRQQADTKLLIALLYVLLF